MIAQVVAGGAEGILVGGAQPRVDAVGTDHQVGLQRAEVLDALLEGDTHAQRARPGLQDGQQADAGMAPPPAPGRFIVIGCSWQTMEWRSLKRIACASSSTTTGEAARRLDSPVSASTTPKPKVASSGFCS